MRMVGRRQNSLRHIMRFEIRAFVACMHVYTMDAHDWARVMWRDGGVLRAVLFGWLAGEKAQHVISDGLNSEHSLHARMNAWHKCPQCGVMSLYCESFACNGNMPSDPAGNFTGTMI